MPNPIWPPIQQTAGSNTFKTISLAGLVPENATAVMLCPTGSRSGTNTISVKPTGQTASYNPIQFGVLETRSSQSMDIICKIGDNRSIDVRGNSAYEIAIFAYFIGNEINLLNNYIDISPTASTSWRTIDLTSYIPSGTTKAYAVFLDVFNRTEGGALVGWRKQGTPKTLTNPVQGYVGTVVVPLNDLNQIELFSNNETNEFWIAGFLTRDVLVYNDVPKIVYSTTVSAFTHYRNSTCAMYEGVTNGLNDRHTQVTPAEWPAGLRGTRSRGYRSYSCLPYCNPNDKVSLPVGYVYTASAIIYETGYWKTSDQTNLFFGSNF